MPTIAGPIRSACKLVCLTLVPLLAACGGGGGDGVGGGGSLAAACSGTVTRATPQAPAPGAPPAGLNLSLALINDSFAQPLFVTSPRQDGQFLFVVEKGGTIQVVQRSSNTVINQFLDVSALVTNPPDGERGLLGLAFDPNYLNNRRFYISYTDQNDNLVVARYLTDPGNSSEAIPTVDSIIISIPNPLGNLFGGGLAFGPDGFLYISRGHGGDNPGSDVGDPNNMAQNLGSLLGKMLRIDVNIDDFPADPNANYGVPPDNPCVGQAGARGEIWSMGLRNPWRFSFDRQGGALYIADVGHQSREEVNVSTVADGAGRGANYGWRIMEGKSCFNPASGCSPAGITQPALDYSSSSGLDCSVVGGYVYRGTDIPALDGTYFYGDFCTGAVRSFRYNGQVAQHAQWPFSPGMITSFGEDAQGEIYITTIEGGLYRISQ